MSRQHAVLLSHQRRLKRADADVSPECNIKFYAIKRIIQDSTAHDHISKQHSIQSLQERGKTHYQQQPSLGSRDCLTSRSREENHQQDFTSVSTTKAASSANNSWDSLHISPIFTQLHTSTIHFLFSSLTTPFIFKLKNYGGITHFYLMLTLSGHAAPYTNTSFTFIIETFNCTDVGNSTLPPLILYPLPFI